MFDYFSLHFNHMHLGDRNTEILVALNQRPLAKNSDCQNVYLHLLSDLLPDNEDYFQDLQLKCW